MRYWLIGLTLAMIGAAQAGHAAGREQQRELFKQAWNAAARGDRARVEEHIRELDGYVLVPYLQYELYRQRIANVPPEDMLEFLARYRDWSFANALELRWLRQLGESGEYDLLLAYGTHSTDPQVRCHALRAHIATGRTEGLQDDIRALWLTPSSLPRPCDPVLRWWRRAGGLNAELAWQRFAMAMQAGETGLATYVRRYLPETERAWADRWLELARTPLAGFRSARQWPDHPRARQMLAAQLASKASRNWQQAADAWQHLERRFSFSDDQAFHIRRQLALFRAVALDEDALAAIDALPERDQQMLEWRLRVALARHNWPEVVASVAAMPATERARARWRYWQARALAELGRPEAALHFAALASEPNYYGFLAADRLGQGYSLCNESLTADAAIQQRLARDAEIERALELYHVGLHVHARRTWNRALSRLTRDELRQAALLAADHGWYERSIHALGDAGVSRAYTWRFPMLEPGRVQSVAGHWQVDSGWVYGLMRAESAMQPDAISTAGARGLLQLMPSTASAVARRNGLVYGGPADLLDPAINIPLGIAHLRELQDRFGNNPIDVAAAYNAGISAAERWRRERPYSAPDIRIETLPYFETRDYVSRVLAFATVYDWQLHGQPRSLAARMGMPGTADRRVDLTCE